MEDNGQMKTMNELMVKKLNLLNAIYSLTKSQANFINDDGIDNLEMLTNKRQRIIDSINVIDKEYMSYYLNLKKRLGINDLAQLIDTGYDGINQLESNILKVKEMLAKIMDIDKQNNKKINEFYNNTKDELKKINRGKKINQIYNYQPLSTGSYYIDKKK